MDNKKVIVLRDIKSNIIDEAYVVLRENVNIRKSKLQYDEKEFLKNKFIYEEAESEINEYVNKQDGMFVYEENRKLVFYNKFFKILVVLLIIVNIFFLN